jgi:hypothetical protein
VSTAEQNPDHQIDALLRAGVDRENTHVDRASGAKINRPHWTMPSSAEVKRALHRWRCSCGLNPPVSSRDLAT